MCSRLIRPLTPLGTLVAGFRGYRRRSRHGRRRIASPTNSTSGVGSGPCQVKAEACWVRYSSALAERRPRIVAPVAGCPHGGRVARAVDGAGCSECLPGSVGGAALHKPISMRCPPGETNFQVVSRTRRQRLTSPDAMKGGATVWADSVKGQGLVRLGAWVEK